MRELSKAFLIAILGLAVGATVLSSHAASDALGFEAPMRLVNAIPAVEVMVNGKVPFLTFPALGNSANIGSKVLSEFSLTFDQKKSRLRLVRKNAGNE